MNYLHYGTLPKGRILVLHSLGLSFRYFFKNQLECGVDYLYIHVKATVVRSVFGYFQWDSKSWIDKVHTTCDPRNQMQPTSSVINMVS